MQGRSIRSFALDYYRKQGAQVRPEGAGESFEIVRPEGQKLTVTFTGDAERPELLPLTTTSPQWRSILEDLTGEVVVSYRYLVAGPIANAVKTLQAAVPQGWTVLAAKLQHVEQRHAIGLTHRVTFDSSALNACQEVIHHHVWDLVQQTRLEALEALLYELPCILLRPEHLPGEPTVRCFVEHSLEIVDAAADAHGAELERELADLLVEAEKRTNQYFDQQLSNVLNREVQLSEKLDAAIRKLGEARTPEQVARFRQDGEVLANQLEGLKARREADMQAVTAACEHKLAQEREKHELTATTDLVALCHAAYDVLTYQARLAGPDGAELDFTLRYWPVTKDLRFPDCPSCERPMAAPTLLSGGRYACLHCTEACEGCGRAHLASEFTSGACDTCEAPTCSQCASGCNHCASQLCGSHVAECVVCEAPVCPGCVCSCSSCAAEGAASSSLCPTHAQLEPLTGLPYCADHLEAAGIEAQALQAAALRAAEEAAEREAEAAALRAELERQLALEAAEAAEREALEALRQEELARQAVLAAEVAARHEAEETARREARRQEELARHAAHQAEAAARQALAGQVAFAPEFGGEPDDGSDEVPADLRGVQFDPAAMVTSALSGKSLHASVAEVCHGCARHFAVQEMHNCRTCGVPSCQPCVAGEAGPCPACDTLEAVEADDARLAFVTASFPELAHGRRWEVGEYGPYVLTMWRRWGTWGMVVYHRGERESVVLTEFRYGALGAMRVALAAWTR